MVEKFPTVLEKVPQNLGGRGGFFDTLYIRRRYKLVQQRIAVVDPGTFIIARRRPTRHRDAATTVEC